MQIDDSLRPQRDLQHPSHLEVHFSWAQDHHIVILEDYVRTTSVSQKRNFYVNGDTPCQSLSLVSKPRARVCNGRYLQSWMSVEFIEKVHEQVYFECADTQHNMFLCLCSVAAVIPPRLLSLHPQVDQLFKLTSSTRCRGHTRKCKRIQRLFQYRCT